MYNYELFVKTIQDYLSKNENDTEGLAKKLGISRATLYNYLSDTSRPSFEKASKIFKKLEYDPQTLYLTQKVKQESEPKKEIKPKIEKGKVEGNIKGNTEGKIEPKTTDFYEIVKKQDFEHALIFQMNKEIERLQNQIEFYQLIIKQNFKIE